MKDRYFETPKGYVGMEVDKFYNKEGMNVVLMYDNGTVESYKEKEIVEVDYQLSLDV